MLNFTSEMITKAKAAKSAEELMAFAKDNNVELTEEEAKTYFEQLHASGAVTDEELDMVAGGCGDRVFLTTADLPNGTLVVMRTCCPSCGHHIGRAMQPNEETNQVSIWCDKCRELVMFQVEASDVRKL